MHSRKVVIIRDIYGVPHIYGGDIDVLYVLDTLKLRII